MQNLKKTAIFVGLIMLAIACMGLLLKAAGDNKLAFLGSWVKDTAKNITSGYGV
jgi:hypothetical protein